MTCHHLQQIGRLLIRVGLLPAAAWVTIATGQTTVDPSPTSPPPSSRLEITTGLDWGEDERFAPLRGELEEVRAAGELLHYLDANAGRLREAGPLWNELVRSIIGVLTRGGRPLRIADLPPIPSPYQPPVSEEAPATKTPDDPVWLAARSARTEAFEILAEQAMQLPELAVGIVILRYEIGALDESAAFDQLVAILSREHADPSLRTLSAPPRGDRPAYRDATELVVQLGASLGRLDALDVFPGEPATGPPDPRDREATAPRIRALARIYGADAESFPQAAADALRTGLVVPGQLTTPIVLLGLPPSALVETYIEILTNPSTVQPFRLDADAVHYAIRVSRHGDDEVVGRLADALGTAGGDGLRMHVLTIALEDQTKALFDRFPAAAQNLVRLCLNEDESPNGIASLGLLIKATDRLRRGAKSGDEWRPLAEQLAARIASLPQEDLERPQASHLLPAAFDLAAGVGDTALMDRLIDEHVSVTKAEERGRALVQLLDAGMRDAALRYLDAAPAGEVNPASDVPTSGSLIALAREEMEAAVAADGAPDIRPLFLAVIAAASARQDRTPEGAAHGAGADALLIDLAERWSELPQELIDGDLLAQGTMILLRQKVRSVDAAVIPALVQWAERHPPSAAVIPDAPPSDDHSDRRTRELWSRFFDTPESRDEVRRMFDAFCAALRSGDESRILRTSDFILDTARNWKLHLNSPTELRPHPFAGRATPTLVWLLRRIVPADGFSQEQWLALQSDIAAGGIPPEAIGTWLYVAVSNLVRDPEVDAIARLMSMKSFFELANSGQIASTRFRRFGLPGFWGRSVGDPEDLVRRLDAALGSSRLRLFWASRLVAGEGRDGGQAWTRRFTEAARGTWCEPFAEFLMNDHPEARLMIVLVPYLDEATRREMEALPPHLIVHTLHDYSWGQPGLVPDESLLPATLWIVKRIIAHIDSLQDSDVDGPLLDMATVGGAWWVIRNWLESENPDEAAVTAAKSLDAALDRLEARGFEVPVTPTGYSPLVELRQWNEHFRILLNGGTESEDPSVAPHIRAMLHLHAGDAEAARRIILDPDADLEFLFAPTVPPMSPETRRLAREVAAAIADESPERSIFLRLLVSDDLLDPVLPRPEITTGMAGLLRDFDETPFTDEALETRCLRLLCRTPEFAPKLPAKLGTWRERMAPEWSARREGTRSPRSWKLEVEDSVLFAWVHGCAARGELSAFRDLFEGPIFELPTRNSRSRYQNRGTYGTPLARVHLAAATGLFQGAAEGTHFLTESQLDGWLAVMNRPWPTQAAPDAAPYANLADAFWLDRSHEIIRGIQLGLTAARSNRLSDLRAPAWVLHQAVLNATNPQRSGDLRFDRPPARWSGPSGPGVALTVADTRLRSAGASHSRRLDTFMRLLTVLRENPPLREMATPFSHGVQAGLLDVESALAGAIKDVRLGYGMPPWTVFDLARVQVLAGRFDDADATLTMPSRVLAPTRGNPMLSFRSPDPHGALRLHVMGILEERAFAARKDDGADPNPGDPR